MDIKVEIDKEQVNKMLVEAILNSAIGEEIEKGVQKFIDKTKETYFSKDTIIYQVVEKEVRKIVSDIVRNEYADTFKQIIKEQLTEDVMAKIAHKALSYLYDGKQIIKEQLTEDVMSKIAHKSLSYLYDD